MTSLDRYLPALIPLAKCVAEAFGSNCETLIHDLSRLEEGSIVFIANDHVTGRKAGDTATNLLLELLQQGLTEDGLYNYETTTSDGRVLRSTSIFLRDETGVPIGAFCINFDTTQVQQAVRVLTELTRSNPTRVNEQFMGDVSKLLNQLFRQAEEHVGKPVGAMQREDKLRAVEFLESKGAFLIRRAVERAAQFLDISRFTIYSYLDQIRARRSGSDTI